MFSRDFARSPYIQVHPTVDLALNFHKKIPLYCPSLLNIFEGGSLLSFCTVTLLHLHKNQSVSWVERTRSSWPRFGASWQISRFHKIDSWNFQHMLDLWSSEASQNLSSFRQFLFSLFHGGTKGKNWKSLQRIVFLNFSTLMKQWK